MRDVKGELYFTVDDHSQTWHFGWYVDGSSYQSYGLALNLGKLLSGAQPYKLRLVGVQFKMFRRWFISSIHVVIWDIDDKHDTALEWQ